MTKAYIDIDIGSTRLGRLSLVLYEDTVPRTVENFKALLQRDKGNGYQGSKFHRIIKGFMAQGGDFGGPSIYGPSFSDENFIHTHDARGMLSMANSGPDTNGSQFFITFRPTPHLNGKHVVFGHVDFSSGAEVLDALERVRTGKNDVPTVPVVISACGLDSPTEPGVQATTAIANEDEIDIDEVEGEDDLHQAPSDEPKESSPEDDETDIVEEDEHKGPKNKSQLLRERLKKLKMKMNQARQLNRSEVLREGERLGSEDGKAKERKRQAVHDKKLRQAEWEAQNGRALDVAAEAGIGDGKCLVEQAGDSLRNARKKAEKKEKSRFGINDYYNPEGQHRNYERNLKSLPTSSAAGHVDNTSTYNPMMAVSSGEKDDRLEQDGARRLANDMKRRIEKQAKNKRDRLEFEGTDVSYINERNKRFNQKISRNFDEHTAEIRQNLERGTAL